MALLFVVGASRAEEARVSSIRRLPPSGCARTVLESATTVAELRERLAAAPGLASIRLEVRVSLDVAMARELASSPVLARAQELILDEQQLTAETAAALARSPHLRRLRKLSVRHAGLGAPELEALFAGQAFPALEDLDLSGNRMEAGGMAAVARLLGARLKKLTVGDADVDGGARRALVALARREALVKIDLGDTKVGAASLGALLAVPRSTVLELSSGELHRLTTAQLSKLAATAPLEAAVRFAFPTRGAGETCATLAQWNRSGALRLISRMAVDCGDEAARLIGRSANAGNLIALSISCASPGGPNHRQTSATARALAESKGLASLRELRIENDDEFCRQPGIGAEGLAALLDSPLAGQLESLELQQQKIGPKAALLLARTDRLPRLRRLHLIGNYLPESEVRALVDGTSPLAGQLEDLGLAGAEIDGSATLDEKSALALARTAKMPRLRRLDLSTNLLSAAAIDRIAQAPWIAGLTAVEMGDWCEPDR